MPALRAFLLLFAFAAASTASAFEPKWEAMRPGLSREQVARTLSVPVLRNSGRGHETWVYDAGASVQFHGGVVSAWTAPKPARSPVAPAVRAEAGRMADAAPTPSRPPLSPRLS